MDERSTGISMLTGLNDDIPIVLFVSNPHKETQWTKYFKSEL